MGKWTTEQIESLADKLAQIFVEQVEAAGGRATIVSREADAYHYPLKDAHGKDVNICYCGKTWPHGAGG